VSVADRLWCAPHRLVLLIAGFAIPILVTWLGYLPFASALGERFVRPLLVYPSLIGTFQVRPLPFSLGNAPTRGQAELESSVDSYFGDRKEEMLSRRYQVIK